jgi:signal transduction histidine kinase
MPDRGETLQGVPTVLLIEDSPEDTQMLRDALAKSRGLTVELAWADRLSRGLERLAQGGVDLVLTDLSLPDTKGLQSVTALRAAAARIPLIVLTSADDEALALEALQQGAQDYLVKGYVQVYPDFLARSIRYAIERHRVEARERELSDAIAAAAVADRKRAAELDQAYQELKRTQALLVQAEKMSAVGQLASGIAHEVKNPLTIILQCVNYLEPELSIRGGQQAEVVQVMREAVMTADKIIRGLLDFSRPAPLELKPCAMGEVIEASLALVQNQLSEKRIRLTREIAPDLPPVLLDANQMKQVFVNLFLNAIQAMPGGGALIVRGSLTRLTEPGAGVGSRSGDAFQVGSTVLVCEVEDTGHGIPKDLLSRVFNPFFTTKPPGEGVGLGLSITATIIEGHRGLIRLESEPGRGTKAVILLPIPTGE